jgi:hypothetical protein
MISYYFFKYSENTNIYIVTFKILYGNSNAVTVLFCMTIKYV